MWANDELKHYDYDEIELRHYGVKGMKWRKKRDDMLRKDLGNYEKIMRKYAPIVEKSKKGELTPRQDKYYGKQIARRTFNRGVITLGKMGAYSAGVAAADAYDKASDVAKKAGAAAGAKANQIKSAAGNKINEGKKAVKKAQTAVKVAKAAKPLAEVAAYNVGKKVKKAAGTAAKVGKTAAKVTVKVKKAQATAKVKKTAKDLKKAVKKKLKR